MRAHEFLNTDLTEAPLGPRDLLKYRGTKKDRIPVFLQKIKDQSAFKIKTKTGYEEVVVDPSEYDRALAFVNNPTRNFSMKSIDGKVIPLGSFVKTSEFGGEEAEGREKIEQGQIGEIQQQLEKLKNENPYIDFTVGDKTVQAASVEKEKSMIFGRAPKSDMTVLNAEGESVAWASLKGGSKFRWGGWIHLANLPEIKNWIERVKKTTGNIFEPGQSYGLHISADLANKIVFGKDFGSNRGISNVDVVLIGNVSIKNNKLSATRVYENGKTPTGGDKPYIVLRYMQNRSDLGFKNCRAETNTVSETRNVKWLDSDSDIPKTDN